MFKGFVQERIKGDGATLFVRRAGPEGAPPIVLLHGYPQTFLSGHLPRFTWIRCIRKTTFQRITLPIL